MLRDVAGILIGVPVKFGIQAPASKAYVAMYLIPSSVPGHPRRSDRRKATWMPGTAAHT